MSPGLRAQRRRQQRTAMLFMSPALLGLLVFFVYPLVATAFLSFTHYDLVSPPRFIGLKNYEFMLHKDPRVMRAAFNTFWLVAVLVPARMLFGLAVATLLIRLRSGVGVFRTVAFLPSLVPPVAGTIAFVFLLNPATGPVNRVLGALHLPEPLWFNDPAWAKPSLVLLGLWGIGDVMIIFLASLLNVPKEQYEAAALDGVNPWQRFRYVTLPSISPVLFFAGLTGVIAALQYFTEAIVASSVASGQATVGGGGSGLLGYPEGSTLTYAQWLYQQGFRNFYLGYASALAMVMFVVAFAVTVLLLRRSKTLTAGPDVA